MKLNLILDEANITLEINNYRSSTEDVFADEWCNVAFSLTSNEWLNYRKSGETLCASEVERLRDKLSSLILDEIFEITELVFINSCFKFILNPKQSDNTDAIGERLGVYDAHAEWRFIFYDFGPKKNYISVRLEGENIKHLINYLNLITEKLDKTDSIIQDMIENGIITE